MFALGIPKSQYRRANDVLTHDLSTPISYNKEKQDDGFFLFSFPEVDEYDFKDIVLILKNNGVTTIGADEQLTERKIMKLTDLLKEQGLNRMNRDMTPEEEKLKTGGSPGTSSPMSSGGNTTKIKLKMSNIEDEVTITEKPEMMQRGQLKDVTISWGNESHTVDFEAGDIIDDHGNEGMDIETSADSDDGRWQFILDVQAEATFPMTGDFADWDWEELIIQDHPENEDHLDPEDRSDFEDEEVAASIAAAQDDINTMEEGMMCKECGEVHEGTCGYGKNGKIGKKPAGPNMLQERFQQLAGIKPLYEQGFDSRFKDAMGKAGFSDDEQDDVMSRDIGDKAVWGDEVMGKILELISTNKLDPMDVMEEIGEEFEIKFEFSGGAPGFKQAGTDAGFDMRGL